MLLSFGMLTLLAYQIMAQQVAWVHNGANNAFHLFASPVDAAMYAWLFIVMLICAVLQTRKGYVDTNRFGQTEHLPAGYFLLIAGITGAASALAIAAMRCIAEAQIVPFEEHFLGSKSGNRRGFRHYDFRRHIRCAVPGILRGEASPRENRSGTRRHR